MKESISNQKVKKLTLSKAMTPGSFLPLRKSHHTEAFSITEKAGIELDSSVIVLHATEPTMVTSQSP